MSSTTDPKAIEPNDVLAARADERLVHAYDEIARADEQLARLNEQLSKLEHDAGYQPSAVVDRRPRGRPALRGLIGLLLALCVFVGAFVSQSSYGDAARTIVARWAPQLILTASLPTEKPGLPAQPSSIAQVAAATPVVPQPTTPSAQTAPQDIAPAAAPISPELAQLLQTMARDLANVEQGIEQLKANQEQAARDNAKATEQLKASQEEMTRLIAKASEQNKASGQNRASGQNLPPRTSAPPVRPIATATRKPVQTHQSPQARAPQAPIQLQPGDQ